MAVHTDALAQVYARSLYELAEAAGGADKIAEVGGELEQICELARGDRSLREFLNSPIIDRTARGQSLQRMFSDRVTDLTLRFLLVLNAKQRLGHLEPINAAYDQLVQEAHGRVEVDVFTPAPLGDEQLQIIRQRVAEALGREPVMHSYSEPEMIGGIKLRVGDQLIDGSVATRLRRMRRDLLASGGSIVRERFRSYLEGESS